MQGNLILPADIKNIVVVDSAEECLTREFTKTVNCYAYPRQLAGDFPGLAQILKGGSVNKARDWNLSQLEELLENFQGSEQQRLALEHLIADTVLLEKYRLRKFFASLSSSNVKREPDRDIYLPHPDGYYKNGRAIVLYTESATGTARPEDFMYVWDSKRRKIVCEFRAGAQKISLGLFSIVRFATEGMYPVPPFIHFGEEGEDRLALTQNN